MEGGPGPGRRHQHPAALGSGSQRRCDRPSRDEGSIAPKVAEGVRGRAARALPTGHLDRGASDLWAGVLSQRRKCGRVLRNRSRGARHRSFRPGSSPASPYRHHHPPPAQSGPTPRLDAHAAGGQRLPRGLLLARSRSGRRLTDCAITARPPSRQRTASATRSTPRQDSPLSAFRAHRSVTSRSTSKRSCGRSRSGYAERREQPLTSTPTSSMPTRPTAGFSPAGYQAGTGRSSAPSPPR